MAHDDCVEGMGGEILLHFFGHFPVGPIYGRMIGQLTVGFAQGIYYSKQLGRALYQSGIAAANLLCQFFAHQQIGVLQPGRPHCSRRQKHFDLRPAAIIEKLDLRRPIYSAVSVYGHFGCMARNQTWEQIDEDLVDSARRLADN